MRERKAELFADDFVFLEAPRWHQDRLWVCDVFDAKLYTLDIGGKRTLVLDALPPRPNSIGFLPDGTPVIVASVQRQLMKIVDGALSMHADLSALATGDLNDFVVDDCGRIYIGNFGYDLFAGAPIAPTDLHVVELDGSVRIAARGVEFPNGSVLTDDGRTLVIAETWAGRLTAFERSPNGDLSKGRIYADLCGRQPDGICLDSAGGIWVASFNTGEVVRVLDGGEVTDRVLLGGHAVACQLGGPDGKTLFCSAYAGTMQEMQDKARRGAVFATRVDVPAAAALLRLHKR